MRMNRWVLGAALALSTTGLVLADAPGRPGGAGGAGAGATTRPREGRGAPRGGNLTVPTNMEGTMKDMDRNYKELKAVATDPARQEATLHAIDMMLRDTAMAKMMVPPIVRRMPAEKRPDAVKSYRTMMNSMLHALLDLEDAVNDKKPDEIKKGLQQIEEIQKQGHAEFAPKEQD